MASRVCHEEYEDLLKLSHGWKFQNALLLLPETTYRGVWADAGNSVSCLAALLNPFQSFGERAESTYTRLTLQVSQRLVHAP